MNPHRETKPHFMRPTQPPPDDQDDLHRPQPPRPAWLRPPITDQPPPRDPLLSVQLDHDHDHRVLVTKTPKTRRSLLSPWRKTQQEPDQPQLSRRRVHPCAACSAVTLSVLLTLAALAILILYIIFRPWDPRLGVSTATLNGLNLTNGTDVLSANLTLVPNFTNPNKKAGVDFKYIVVELYFGRTIIATKYVEQGVSAAKGGTRSVEVDMVASGVQLFELQSQRLKRQIEKDKVVVFEVKGRFLVHTKFGPLVRYSYWMHGQCILTLKKPPHGVLVSTRCNTKHDQKFV